MARRSSKWQTLAAILLLLVAVLRGVGGIIMIAVPGSVGSPTLAPFYVDRLIGLAICLISTIGVTAGIGLIRGREQPRAPWIFLALFLIDGAVNGWIWFGHPILSGQIANFTVSFIIGAMLLIGRTNQTA